MQVLRNSLVTGGLASLVTTAATALLGRREGNTWAEPINATSHVIHGKEAYKHEEVDAKHTLTGLALNAAAMIGWAVLHEGLFGRQRKPKGIVESLATGAAVSGLAYVTDYHVVPKRLTPGFEEKLSKPSLGAVYGVLAVGLALGALMRK